MGTLTTRKIFTLLFLGIFLIAGCEDSAGPDPADEAPELPPSGTFIMDFSDFDSSTVANAKTAAGANWTYSAINVGVWNFILTIGLAVPVASFTAAFNRSDPVQQNDGSWIWTYNFAAAGARHTAKLQAQTENGGVRWDMFISRENGFTDYHWYTGWANLVNTEGYWILNKRDLDVEFLRIDWTRNTDNSVAQITYTDIEDGAITNGNYISYGINQDTTYNANYNIYNVVDSRLLEIEWHRFELNGRVKDEVHFGNPNWQCWDQSLNDVTCP